MAGHALVVEGGGMKGAYANGVLSAFEEAGLPRFDALYGTSAGGALCAWYAAGQARYAEGTWKYAADRRIVSYSRWALRRGPLLDHEFLLDAIYQREHPLDITRLLACPVPVIVTATDVDSGEVHYQDLRESDPILWLKATGRLPFASGPPVHIGSRRFLDGGIGDPIPIRRAVQDGHTNITLVLNEPAGAARPDHPALARMLAKRYPALADGILRHSENKAEAIGYAQGPPPGVVVRIVRPRTATGLHRLSRDLAAIGRGLEQGRADGWQFLSALRHVPESLIPT